MVQSLACVRAAGSRACSSVCLRNLKDRVAPAVCLKCVNLSKTQVLGENELVPPRWILAGVAFGWSTLVSAQIVECIDVNGKKAYMQTCPDGTVKQRDIVQPTPAPPLIPTPLKPGLSNDASKQSLNSQEKAFEQRREARLKAVTAAAESEKDVEEARQTCADDRRRLNVLETGRPSKRVDPDTGEHLSMDENQRQGEIEKLNAQIQSMGDACQ
jgi:hypothetical protein